MDNKTKKLAEKAQKELEDVAAVALKTFMSKNVEFAAVMTRLSTDDPKMFEFVKACFMRGYMTGCVETIRNMID